MFLNSFKKKLIDDKEDNRYYQSQYRTKLREIESSFQGLKKATTGLIKQANDVTDQLKRNVELYERRLDAIVNNVNDMIIIKTINHQWTVVNQFACNLLQIDRDQCIGKSNDEVVEKYPQLKTLLNALNRTEQESWISRQPKQIFFELTIGNDPINFEIIVKPIETADQKAHEIIVIGRIAKQ